MMKQTAMAALFLALPMMLCEDLHAQRTRRGRGKTNTMVDVFLKNNEKVRGVVKDGRYVEKASGIGYVVAKRVEPDAGIRLWFVEGAESTVFIPYPQVRSYRVVRTLTELEVKEYEQKSREEALRKAKEAREAARKRAELRDAQASDKELLEKLQKLAGEEEASQEADKEARAFLKQLAEFSPEDGWTPQRLIEIRRRIAIDLFPTKQERKFIQEFEAWKPAYSWWNGAGKAKFKSLQEAQKWAASGKPSEKPVKVEDESKGDRGASKKTKR